MEEHDLSKTNSQKDHPLQHLPSLQESQQDHGDQHHPVCLGVHRLPSHPLVHLYQEGRQDQQVQDYPRRGRYDTHGMKQQYKHL